MDALTFHRAANLFPLQDETIDELAEDIKAHGLQCPIELLNGEILDGRRRYLACRMADVEPEYVTVSPDDPAAYVFSLNYHRRHLNTSQKAMVAGRFRDYYDEEAKQRQKEQAKRNQPQSLKVVNFPPLETSSARDAAGKAVGVSGKSVDFATKVLKHGTPELIKAVEAGKMAVSTAAVYASEPSEVQNGFVLKQKQRVYEPKGRAKSVPADPEPLEPGKSRGLGVQRAHEAIACLKKIPVNDALRKRGLQIVLDWIKHNK